jgi:hypothetical protein
MRKVVVLFTFMVILLSSGPASAFTHYTQNTFATAESLDPGMTQMGIHYSESSDHYVSFYPSVRYGLGAMFEIGGRFGVTSADIDSTTKLGGLVGIDLKYQLVKETEGIPLDMAVDLGWDDTFVNHLNASEVTFSAIFSKSIPLTDRGNKLVPYGGIEMAALYGSAIPKSDTTVYGFGGIEWKLTPQFMFMLELKAGESSIAGIGIRFEY